MAAGAVAFCLYARGGSLGFLYVVLFFMGAHSAFFGPAKYGILPEMLRGEDLPRANGFMLMTTFLAIIFGTVVAGVLLDYFRDRLWIAFGRLHVDRSGRHASPRCGSAKCRPPTQMKFDWPRSPCLTT